MRDLYKHWLVCLKNRVLCRSSDTFQTRNSFMLCLRLSTGPLRCRISPSGRLMTWNVDAFRCLCPLQVASRAVPHRREMNYWYHLWTLQSCPMVLRLYEYIPRIRPLGSGEVHLSTSVPRTKSFCRGTPSLRKIFHQTLELSFPTHFLDLNSDKECPVVCIRCKKMQ